MLTFSGLSLGASEAMNCGVYRSKNLIPCNFYAYMILLSSMFSFEGSSLTKLIFSLMSMVCS